MTDETEEEDPLRRRDSQTIITPTACHNHTHHKTGFFSRLKNVFKPDKSDASLRAAIEEYIDEQQEEDPVSRHERDLFSNILKLRDIRVQEVMIPRADIVAIDVGISKNDLHDLLIKKQYSRIPVYKDTLDDVLGTVHLKDITAALVQNQDIVIKDLITETPIVSPAMPVLDLLLTMRQNRRHMALVVDEYGGIDGLVTIGDIIETIIGEIDDEHDSDEETQIKKTKDGALLVDARVDIEEFEDQYGRIFTEEEREESDTLGGLVFSLAGRIPARGEVLTHESGLEFEVLDADQRRINRMKIRNMPPRQEDADAA
ncbi:MAG: HlyC/CorC family transporter [Alphaproteobacteria bacterium]|nr:HlyC/CorC family transporter [Alphaproteobacteria bacterium]